MNSETIYSILASKPHNPHYLKRYIRFVTWCQQNPSTEDYTEEHHICPKADDFFPSYIDFKVHQWNRAQLTTKQHLIAHVMLWKAYPYTSMSLALDCMLGNFNSETNSRLINRKIPTAMRIRYLARTRKEAAIKRGDYVRGKSTFKDSSGNKYFLETTDPLIKELNLVGNNSGHEHSEESKAKMSATKEPNKKITLYKLDKKKIVKFYSDEYAQLISDGWHDTLTDEDRRYIQDQTNAKNSEFWTGRARYALPDGTYHGAYLHTDPIITELGLIKYYTEKQRKQNASRSILGAEAKLGTNIYNNGTEEKFFITPPDASWSLGRLPRSDDWESKRRDATVAACKGKKTYNNGLVNRFFADGEPIPEGFVRGMKPRK